MASKGKFITRNPELEKKVHEEAKQESRSFSAHLWRIVRIHFENQTK